MNPKQVRATSRDSPKKKVQQKQYTYGQLKLGDVPSRSKKFTLKTFFGNPEFQIFCIRFDYEDTTITAGCSDGTVKVFNLLTGKLAFNLQGSSDGQSPTTSVRWRRDVPDKTKGVFLTTNADGSIMYWHAQTGKQLHRIVEQNNQVLCLDIRNDGDMFATAGKDFKIRLYDDEKKEVIRVIEPGDYNQPGHANRIFSLKFLEDNQNVLVSGGWDGNVFIWDVRDGKSSGHIFGPSISGDSIDYKNGKLLTGSYRTNDQLELWDLGTRKVIQSIPWIQGDNLNDYYVYCCQFSKINNDTIMAGSSGRQELKLFDINQNYQPCVSIQELQEGVYACDYGNKTNKFAFGGGEGVVYVCSISNHHKIH